ncbi:hypothetical protein [Zhongshania sp.]|uniref:hypothetical protein n=1 Tax=Zhongshania sp. TaxID=1971902 RepID=UPI002A80A21C|nr:hypothetical protein [Zhongshania sp.]
MNLSIQHKRLSLAALLLLCLSWSLWLQGNHVHVAEHSPLSECVVCHYSGAAATSEPFNPYIPAFLPSRHESAIPDVFRTSPVLRPPARAPPVFFV